MTAFHGSTNGNQLWGGLRISIPANGEGATQIVHLKLSGESRIVRA